MYQCATRVPRVTHTGTYGPGKAPLRGCIGLHLILYSLHSSVTDRRRAMSHSNTPPVRNRAPLAAWSSSLKGVYHQPSTALKNTTAKTTGQNSESIFQEAIYHGTLARTSSRYQVFEKLIWRSREDASQWPS